ncbi:MAG: hypothetical protein AAGA60_26665 [Cyanobacteria bacterium P01_E01_bin.42]
MTILIANIGTSDLAVKLSRERDFFIPIGFDRNEPNTKAAESELDDAELQLWRDRGKLVREKLYSSWQVKTFRDYTELLLKEYEADPRLWHDRIRPGRILGIIEEAVRESVRDVYVFVTDQPEFVEGEKNKGYDSDTIHLFSILKYWIEQKFDDRIELHSVIIPKSISAIDQDGLFGKYYDFFNHRDINEMTLISVKGGTPQMQAALRVQAMSSGIVNQIYLEPQLSIKKLLAGEASVCNKISYWRYQSVQKYQTVKRLLGRWDFDGANEILTAWSKTLKQLEIAEIGEVKKSRDSIEFVKKALQMAVGFFNLDSDYAKQQVKNGLNDLKILSDAFPDDAHRLGGDNRFFPKLLNLYTQCCLLWETDRMADFLTRMGSFYEETLHELIWALDGAIYFDKPEQRGNWLLQTEELLNQNKELAQIFYECEADSNHNKLISALRSSRCLDDGVWERPLNHPHYRDKFTLPGRPTKRNFVYALVKQTGTAEQKVAASSLVEAMRSLDYWCLKRNQLIHGAKGISKQRLIEVLKEDRVSISSTRRARARNNRVWIDFDLDRCIDVASCPDLPQCPPNQTNNMTILKAMTIICESTMTLMQRRVPPSLFDKEANYLDPFAEPHYLYSDIRRWVIETLNRDR